MTDKQWSQKITEASHAMDIEPGVFTWKDPKRIAESLKKSANESTTRKADPFKSSMSLLTFYINRSGKTLDPKQKEILEKAKDELRKTFSRI